MCRLTATHFAAAAPLCRDTSLAAKLSPAALAKAGKGEEVASESAVFSILKSVSVTFWRFFLRLCLRVRLAIPPNRLDGRARVGINPHITFRSLNVDWF
jgi:hypothetical protein